MIKEIGSTYWLDPNELNSIVSQHAPFPNILGRGESYVSTCRSAIDLVIDKLEVTRKVALVPSFACQVVVNTFLNKGFEVAPYPVGKDLLLHWDDFKAKIDKVKPTVILTHPYFGFNTTEELRPHLDELHDAGIVLIEDMTQSMFSEFEPLKADYHVGSIRKWMPVPDGAFTTVLFKGDEDKDLEEAKLKAFVEKGDYILYEKGDKSTFRKDYADAEHILDSQDHPYLMSAASRAIYNSVDKQQMKKTRWDNYNYLEDHILNDKNLTEHIDLIIQNVKGSCPFHLPVYIKNGRKELQQFLAQHDIYATIIWACPAEFQNVISDDVKYIYEHIICFHVDQRYGLDDMQRIYETLKMYYK